MDHAEEAMDRSPQQPAMSRLREPERRGSGATTLAENEATTHISNDEKVAKPDEGASIDTTSTQAAAAAAATKATADVDLEKGQRSNDKPEQTSERDVANIVSFDKDDPANPKNWSLRYRAFCTLQLALIASAASLGSSIISPAAEVISEEFNVSQQLVVFNVSLYVFGFALGPLIWAGMSETFGRRWSLLPALFGLGVFSIGSAVSRSASALFITRFFGGVFGSGPVSNVGASLGDMYPPKLRGKAVSLYALAVVGGPTLGPVIGSALTVKASWRWTEYLIAIYTFALLAVALFWLPETYAPVLLKRKAIRLRKETGNQDLYHPHELVKLDFKSIVTKQVTRPLRMLFTEPIVSVIAVYASFVYALLYMTLEIFPLIFREIHGWKLIPSTLPFISLFVGIVCALSINLGNAYHYDKAVDRLGGKPAPEARLPPMMIGSVLFCVGLFWMGWTASVDHPWILPVLAAAFIGAGFNCVFQSSINILVDSYTLYAASAVSANTFLRSVLGATLPFSVHPMFQTLGPAKAMSILGALAAAAIPVPFIFLKYGRTLRSKSKFAQV